MYFLSVMNQPGTALDPIEENIVIQSSCPSMYGAVVMRFGVICLNISIVC